MQVASVIRANAAFASSPSARGLVALFVGATSGIGEGAMKAFVANTVSPTVYFVGRSESAGTRIAAELRGLNGGCKPRFMQADITLLSTVDALTAEIAGAEEKLDLLFMSPGYMKLSGREESPEGLDRKMVVSYYGRLRFAVNLLPLLQKSGRARVISVLAPGREAPMIMSDLSLRAPGNYSLRNVEKHTVTMNTLALEELAKRYPNVGWIHAIPGVVLTGLLRELPAPVRAVAWLATPLLKFVAVPIEESGQWFAYLSTDEKFGKGFWGVNWKGEDVDPRTAGGSCCGEKPAWDGDENREAVWKHMQEMFDSVKR